MKRNVVVGAWFFVAVMSAWSCAEVIGLPDGEAVTPCQTGKDKRCVDNAVQECVNGLWTAAETCVSQTCVEPAACVGECEPADKKCEGKVSLACDGGKWPAEGETCPYICNANNGVCDGECVPGDKRCSGNKPQACDLTGYWQDATPCTVSAPWCDAGTCKNPPSCTGLSQTCGPAGNESCCAITDVPGGTYNRSNDAAYPATVSSFWLDRFEITVGRFRTFVEAYPGSKPAANAGAHPLIPGSGWDAAWNVSLPVDQATLKNYVKQCGTSTVWTDAPGANENLPMNCFSWYEALAFCAWDGGRLPTEAEWNYAAAGGDQQRQYPWSTPPNSTTIDASYAVYECNGNGNADCVFADILKVGSKSPKGDGRWGQADLGGSMYEWNLDQYDPYVAKCNNCANILSVSSRVIRGGYWFFDASYLLSSGRNFSAPGNHYRGIGARCAGTPM